MTPPLDMAGASAPERVLPDGRTRIMGMPGSLPEGETILWQGRPAWRPLARRLCHLRLVSIYLGVVVAATAVLAVIEGDTAGQTAAATLPLAAACVLVVAFLAALAWLVARSTEYTITSRRLVIRHGVALQATLAIPHRAIARAALAVQADGTGDLPIETKPGFAVALHRVWPHARPGRWMQAQPMLRSVPDAQHVAATLTRALRDAAGLPVG